MFEKAFGGGGVFGHVGKFSEAAAFVQIRSSSNCGPLRLPAPDENKPTAVAGGGRGLFGSAGIFGCSGKSSSPSEAGGEIRPSSSCGPPRLPTTPDKPTAVAGDGRGLFGSAGIFGCSAGKTSSADTAGAPMSFSSNAPPRPLSTAETVDEHSQPQVVVFSRGQKAAQRCLRLIKIFGVPKANGDAELNFYTEEHSRPVVRPGRFLRSGGWNLEPLRVLLDDKQNIVDDCVSRMENDCRTRLGALASLFFDTSVASTTAGLSSTCCSGSDGRVKEGRGRTPHQKTGSAGAEMFSTTNHKTLCGIADDVADLSSRFVKEFERFRRSSLSGLCGVGVGAGGQGEILTAGAVACAEDEKDEFRAAGPGFSPKLLLAFLSLGERIGCSLTLLARRADEVDDLPMQIVVTSMNGDDLFKHEALVFLSCANAQKRANVGDVKDLVRTNIRERSAREREAIDAEEQRWVAALGKQFWAAVGGVVPGKSDLRKQLADGFQEIIFEEPVSTLECGSGHLVLAVGFHYKCREHDMEVSRSSARSSVEFHLVPVLYFVSEQSASAGSRRQLYAANTNIVDWSGEQLPLEEGSFFWSGTQLLNFMLDEVANNRWQHQAQSQIVGREIQSAPPDRFEELWYRGGSTKPTLLTFDRGVEAAIAAHAKLTLFLASAEQPVMTFFSGAKFVGAPLGGYSAQGRWFRQSNVSRLRGCTVSPEASVGSLFEGRREGVRMKWNVEILNQLTDGQSAVTNRKLREEIDAARLHRCPDFIRSQAEYRFQNDGATTLDRLEIIPYGSTDICDDDTALLDLVQNEKYGAEFDDVDPIGKTIATVRFHAVLRAATLSSREGQQGQGTDGGEA